MLRDFLSLFHLGLGFRVRGSRVQDLCVQDLVKIKI